MKTTNCCLKKLLDQFRGHSNSETTGSPEGPAQEERRHWEGETAVRGRTRHAPATRPSSPAPPLGVLQELGSTSHTQPMNRKSKAVKDRSKRVTCGTEPKAASQIPKVHSEHS